jgi:hypothetical protein
VNEYQKVLKNLIVFTFYLMVYAQSHQFKDTSWWKPNFTAFFHILDNQDIFVKEAPEALERLLNVYKKWMHLILKLSIT